MVGRVTDRTLFQGVGNVVRFNWPVYVAALTGWAILFAMRSHLGSSYDPLFGALLLVLGGPVLASLAATAWVYDFSDLYALPWLEEIGTAGIRRAVVITTGFDEISGDLASRLPQADVRVLDVFDSRLEHEASIVRARGQTRRGSAAVSVDAANLPLENGAVDLAVAFLSAHEIRDDARRIAMFAELRRSLSPDGWVIVVEHQRDIPNLLAYTVGVRHFLARDTWRSTFAAADLRIVHERTHTPLVHAFLLQGP